MKSLAISLLVLALFATISCGDPNTKLSKQSKDIVAKAFEAVGNGDYDNMGNFIADDYVRHSQATPDLNVRSLGEFKEFIRMDRIAVPDQYIDVKTLVAEGNLVAFWATYHGTQTGQMGPFPPSHKTVSLDFSGVHRVEDGKIAETWITWDNLTILSQLGHFPPPSQAQGMED